MKQMKTSGGLVCVLLFYVACSAWAFKTGTVRSSFVQSSHALVPRTYRSRPTTICISQTRLLQELKRPAENVQWGAALSLVLVLVFQLSPACSAASPDLSHTPLANKKVNVVLEGRPRVVDGDTLVFEETSGQKERVRLLGIDAPESKQMCTSQNRKEYACGVESKAFLETIIGKDPVQCLSAKRDQYSRVLGVCFDERTGKDLNEAMVLSGEAVAYVQFSKAYAGDEAQAMQDHRGLWQGQFQKPWEYRKMKRNAPKSTVKAPTNYVVSENKKVKEAKAEFELPEEFLDADDAE